MKADVIAWSSVVGTGILLKDDTGRVVAQLALHNVADATKENRKSVMMEMAQAVADAINGIKADAPAQVERPRTMGGDPGLERMR